MKRRYQISGSYRGHTYSYRAKLHNAFDGPLYAFAKEADAEFDVMDLKTGEVLHARVYENPELDAWGQNSSEFETSDDDYETGRNYVSLAERVAYAFEHCYYSAHMGDIYGDVCGYWY